jgi:hypothetical protein
MVSQLNPNAPAFIPASLSGATSQSFKTVVKKSKKAYKRKVTAPKPSKLSTMPYKKVYSSKTKSVASSHLIAKSCGNDKKVTKSPSPHTLNKNKKFVPPSSISFQAPQEPSSPVDCSSDFAEFHDCVHLSPFHHELLDKLIEKEKNQAAFVSKSQKQRKIVKAVHAHHLHKFKKRSSNLSPKKSPSPRSRCISPEVPRKLKLQTMSYFG